MKNSPIKKIKSSNLNTDARNGQDVFFMSLEEARNAISDKYEFLANRYEQQFPKHKGLS